MLQGELQSRELLLLFRPAVEKGEPDGTLRGASRFSGLPAGVPPSAWMRINLATQPWTAERMSASTRIHRDAALRLKEGLGYTDGFSGLHAAGVDGQGNHNEDEHQAQEDDRRATQQQSEV
jgi:hypothetical protein